MVTVEFIWDFQDDIMRPDRVVQQLKAALCRSAAVSLLSVFAFEIQVDFVFLYNFYVPIDRRK